MTQHVQELIDKIKTEGLEVSKKQAREIEDQAKQEAQRLIDEGKQKAQQYLREAEAQAHQQQEAAQMALKQAARDLLLSLRKEIEAMLHQIITCKVDDALNAQALTNLLTQIITQQLSQPNAPERLEVAVAAKDLELLQGGVLSQLQAQVKARVCLESDDNVTKGFAISFDGGKSCFDFSTESLAQYLSRYLNQHVAALLKEVA